MQANNGILNRVNLSGNEFLKILILGSFDVGLCFNFTSCQHFSLLCSSWFLYLTFQLFLWFSFRISLGYNSHSSQPVNGLIFNQVLLIIIRKCKSSWTVSTKCSSKTKKDYVFRLPFVFGCNQLSQILLGDIRLAFVVDVKKKLTTG